MFLLVFLPLVCHISQFLLCSLVAVLLLSPNVSVGFPSAGLSHFTISPLFFGGCSFVVPKCFCWFSFRWFVTFHNFSFVLWWLFFCCPQMFLLVFLPLVCHISQFLLCSLVAVLLGHFFACKPDFLVCILFFGFFDRWCRWIPYLPGIL